MAKRTDRDDGLTRTGPIGTPGYMSPEAAAGRVHDLAATADVYGLGATLYFLLTGRPPFPGGDGADVLRRVVAEEPERPRAVRPEVPAELEAVVVRAMEKNPARRYATAEAFATDLRRFLAGERPVAPVLTRRRRVRRWLVRNRRRLGAVVGCVLVVTGLVVIGRLSRPTPDPVPPPADPAEWFKEARAKLAAGEPVELIGRTGLPKYHRFILEPNGLGESELGDGTCAFHAFNTCLLELFPDPGIDRYQVRLEVRQTGSKDAGRKQAPSDYTGVYFGYGAGTATDRTVAHALFAVTYKDYHRAADPLNPENADKFPVHLQRLGFFQPPDPDRAIPAIQVKRAALRFTVPPPREPGVRRVGEWRPVVIDVGPEEARVRWLSDPDWMGRRRMESLVDWTEKRPVTEYEKLKAGMEASAPGAAVALPAWSPRMPFGIVSYKSSVAVRKVVIEPRP